MGWTYPHASPWRLCRTNPDYLHYLSEATGLRPVTTQILVGRGLKTPETIRRFLPPSADAVPAAPSLPDMAVAVERLRRAAQRRERVLVFGDYDADGLTATAILIEALRRLGLAPLFRIPHRLSEGYGLRRKAVEEAAAAGCTLIVTADSGTTAVDETRLASRLGIDLVITDHHAQTTDLPDAVAVVNPARQPDTSRDPDPAGAGVAFYLAQALLGRDASGDLVDLAAVGTVADVVALRGGNRDLVRAGLEAINRGQRPGLRALAALSDLRGEAVTARTLAFRMAPRMNAAGRLDDATAVVELLTTRDHDRAREIAEGLDALNRRRQHLGRDIHASAMERIGPEQTPEVVALADPDWHRGVVGIVAARLAENLLRPAFLFQLDNGRARGSGRSVPGFDLMPALAGCRDLLEAWGGHSQAAGLTLPEARLPEFRKRISRVFADAGGPDAFAPSLRIDAETGLRDLDDLLAEEFERLEPYGHANEEPRLGLRNVLPVRPHRVKDRHLKLGLRQDGVTAEAIGFGMGALLERLEPTAPLDAVVTLSRTRWNGRQRLELRLQALRQGVS